MPVESAKEYRFMRMKAAGKGEGGPSPAVAKEMLEKTGHEKRSEFARAKRGSSKRRGR